MKAKTKRGKSPANSKRKKPLKLQDLHTIKNPQGGSGSNGAWNHAA
jgi:hypothetical protein